MLCKVERIELFSLSLSECMYICVCVNAKITDSTSSLGFLIFLTPQCFAQNAASGFEPRGEVQEGGRWVCLGPGEP